MIHAVILAGGWGRRFWPKARRKFPKQLLYLSSRYSPLQSLVNIIKSEIPKERIWVAANKEYVQSLRRHLPFLCKNNFLVEPCSRNTAAAVGWAAAVIKRIDPQAICVVLSSDYLIKPKARFLQAIKAACAWAAKEDALVTVGIRPERPAQEYGYLKIIKNAKLKMQNEKVYKVERFVEKPTIERARAYLRSKRYLWNSGIFVCKAQTILSAIQHYLPQLSAGLTKIEKAKGCAQYQRCLVKEYCKLKDISIDYGVMEKAGNIYAVVGNFTWQDLGSWSSLSGGHFAQDRAGNVIFGRHKGIKTSDSVIFSEGRHLIATVGLRGLVIVHTPSATLVCRKDQTQQVKELTQMLEKDKQLKKYL